MQVIRIDLVVIIGEQIAIKYASLGAFLILGTLLFINCRENTDKSDNTTVDGEVLKFENCGSIRYQSVLARVATVKTFPAKVGKHSKRIRFWLRIR